MDIIDNLCDACIDKDEDEANTWVIFYGEDERPCAVQCVEHGNEATLVLDPFGTAVPGSIV
jgi:hypothetical protein